MIKSFLRNEDGSFAPMFAILAMPLILASGAAIDYSNLVRTRSHLQSTLDSGILAANLKTLSGAAEANTLISSYVVAQIPTNTSLRNLALDTTLSTDGRTITVTANADVKNFFMGIVNKPYNHITLQAQTVRGMDNAVELVMVLDVTGSMNQNNKLPTLKSSASLLIDTLTSDPKNNVKIGLVPFSQYVNVGTAYRGAAWLTRSDDYSTTSTQTVAASCTTKKDIVSQTCTKVQTVSYNDGVPVYGTTNQCTNIVYGAPYQVCTPASTKTTTTTYKWTGCVGSRPQPNNLTDDNPTIQYPALYNTSCNAPLSPLSTNFMLLKSTINGLIASGETYTPAGLVWGLNVLSPGAPLTEGGAYDPNQRKPRKVMVFMTDGVNTKSMSSATSTTHTGTNRTDADTATKTLCANIKAKGIEVFSIALMVDDTNAKTMLQGCASDAKHYYDATDTSALTAAFQNIAFTLQTPYLAK